MVGHVERASHVILRLRRDSAIEYPKFPDCDAKFG